MPSVAPYISAMPVPRKMARAEGFGKRFNKDVQLLRGKDVFPPSYFRRIALLAIQHCDGYPAAKRVGEAMRFLATLVREVIMPVDPTDNVVSFVVGSVEAVFPGEAKAREDGVLPMLLALCGETGYQREVIIGRVFREVFDGEALGRAGTEAVSGAGESTGIIFSRTFGRQQVPRVEAFDEVQSLRLVMEGFFPHTPRSDERVAAFCRSFAAQRFDGEGLGEQFGAELRSLGIHL